METKPAKGAKLSSHWPMTQVSCDRIEYIKIQSEILLPEKKSVKKPHLNRPPELRSAHKKLPRMEGQDK